MISIFTRKELLVTFDMKRQNEVCDILSANGVKCAVQVSTRLHDSSRARSGSYGMNTDSFYEYKIYVHKNNYDYAMSLIR